MGDSASFGDSSRISRSERHNQERMNYGLTIIIINIIIDSELSTSYMAHSCISLKEANGIG